MEKYYEKFAEILVKVLFWGGIVVWMAGSLLAIVDHFILADLVGKVELLHSGLNKVFQFLSAGQSQ